MDHFEEALDEEVDELKAQFRERLKQEAISKLKRCFKNINPKNIQAPGSPRVKQFRSRYLYHLGLQPPSGGPAKSGARPIPAPGTPLRKRSKSTVSALTPSIQEKGSGSKESFF